VVAATAFVAALTWDDDSRAADEAPAEPVYTFVSMPDFLNADIGDLRELRTWRRGFGNSTSPKFEASVATVLDEVAAEDPDSVFVAGDLVEGHWGVDADGTGFFGPPGTRDQRRAQIRRAGNFYYREWKERYAARGLQVYPAIGDHEIGDDPWKGCRGYGAGNDFKRRSLPIYKRVWADNFPIRRAVSRPVGTNFEGTAYAVNLTPDILLVTVDEFARRVGDVDLRLTKGQLAWLDGVLDNATAGTVMVQAHLPVLWPVRAEHSSRLHLEGGRSSPLWKMLVAHKVDLYLAGEVHTVTALKNRGVTQVTHGGLIRTGRLHYMVGKVYAYGQIDLEIHRFHARVDETSRRMWCTDPRKRFLSGVVYQSGTRVTGTMTVGQPGTGELR